MDEYFDIDAGKAAAEEGIARSNKSASAVNKRLAKEAIEKLATRQQFITSEDVWRELGSTDEGRLIDPKKGSFLGSILRECSANGTIGLFVGNLPSQRPPNHKRIMRVWESRVYTGVRIESVQQKYDKLLISYQELEARMKELTK